MRTHRILTALFCVLALTTGLHAQATQGESSPATMPQAEAIGQYLPSDAMGFAYSQNIQTLFGNIDTFLNDIGVGPMMGLNQIPGGSLTMIRMQAMLGEGFNANGGFAFVMLDPQQFGIDLVELMTNPGAPREQDVKMPFIILLPGASVEKVFSAYPLEQNGEVWTVNLRVGPMLAIQMGDYIALSSREDALKAFKETPKDGLAKLAPMQKALTTKADIFVSLNMKICGPLYVRLMQRQMETAGASTMPAILKAVMDAYLPLYQQIFDQMSSLAFSLELGGDGVIIHEAFAFDPESKMGKAMAAYKPLLNRDQLLSRMPNLPYVLAIGGNMNNDEYSQTLIKDFIEKLLASEAMQVLSEEQKQTLHSLATTFYEQVSSMQFVGGGAPEGSGVFGLAMTMTCKDAETVKNLIKEKTAIAKPILVALLGPENAGELDGVDFIYSEGIETVDGIAVDSIDITVVKEEIGIEEKNDMVKALGEDLFRIRVIKTDENTVLLTFGGGQAFAAKAIETAKSGKGDILASEGMAMVLANLPADAQAVGFFSVKNLLQVIATGTKAFDPEAFFPLQLSDGTPIAFGVTVKGTEGDIMVFIPKKLLSEGMQLFMMAQMGMLPGPTTEPQTEPYQDETDEDM